MSTPPQKLKESPTKPSFPVPEALKNPLPRFGGARVFGFCPGSYKKPEIFASPKVTISYEDEMSTNTADFPA
jgi:hypothetical protein